MFQETAVFRQLDLFPSPDYPVTSGRNQNGFLKLCDFGTLDDVHRQNSVEMIRTFRSHETPYVAIQASCFPELFVVILSYI